MKNTACIIILLLALIGCKYSNKDESYQVKYVKEAFEIIDQNIINEKGINIDSLEEDLLSKIDSSTLQDSIYQLLRTAVGEINRHSDLFPPIEFSERVESPERIKSRGRIIYDSIAYVHVPACEAIDSVNANLYADSLRNQLVELYQLNPAGWIIDLRDNTGGNMYAMIAGLGPLFQEGALGYDIGKTESAWFFKEKLPSGEIDFIELADSDYEFEKKLPVVVLINGQTGSAAEALTISLMCYPKSIIIGQKTYGVSTGNEMFFLSDSACLNITTSIMADCNKKMYPNGIEPDVKIDQPLKLFEYAVQWINENKS